MNVLDQKCSADQNKSFEERQYIFFILFFYIILLVVTASCSCSFA